MLTWAPILSLVGRALVVIGVLMSGIVAYRKQRIDYALLQLSQSDDENDAAFAAQMRRQHQSFFLGLTTSQLMFFWGGIVLLALGNLVLLLLGIAEFTSTHS